MVKPRKGKSVEALIDLEESREAEYIESSVSFARTVPDIEEIMMGRSLIFRKYESGMVKLTNFTPSEVVNIYRMCLPRIIKENTKRGKKPSLTFLDHVFCYLYALKSGQTMASLSVNIGESESTLHSAIRRIRPIVTESLNSNTFIDRPAPNPLSIGLICDCSTFQVYRPSGFYDESKKMFDVKNNIYGIKVLFFVNINVWGKVKCVFLSNPNVGSSHDFLILKNLGINNEIKEYLVKTKEDMEREDMDKYEDMDIEGKFGRDYDSFCVLGDSAYICSQEIQNKIGYRILAVPKYKSKDEDVANRGKYLASRRVHVEQFFGRLVGAWNTFRHVYRFEHKHFQMDIENAVNLTNILTDYNGLGDEDSFEYKNWLETRYGMVDERKKNKLISNKKWRNRKKKRLNDSQDNIQDFLNNSLDDEEIINESKLLCSSLNY
ncbi:hypothetical protein ACTFIZ_012856 [Dictyostelium cf. discoideum]